MIAASCQRVALSPAPPGAPGIVLSLAPRPLPLSPLIVHGAFLLDPDQAQALSGDVHRSIVLLVQHGSGQSVFTPFREQVLFADDVAAMPNGAKGFFSLDVFELQGGFAAGRYHLLVSMGSRVSAVLDTAVQ